LLVSQMKTRFQSRAMGLASALSDTEIVGYLSSAYQWTLPGEVYGLSSEGEWELATVAGTQTYAMPATVLAHRDCARLDGAHDLAIYNGWPEFWRTHSRTNTNQGRPRSILFYERAVTLYPIPDAAYTIRIPIRTYPATGLTASSEIPNDLHAKAVIEEALIDFAEDNNLTDQLDRRPFADRYISKLRRADAIRPREAVGGGDF